MFFENQSDSEKKSYIELLQFMGSISKFFSENKVPYLYYRVAENIFCKALNAHNVSRGDVSFDAFKGNIGIGIKTFIHGNGKGFQKIAEFNRDSDSFRNLKDKDIIKTIAKLRNDRLSATERAHDTEEMIYHLVTRKEGAFEIHEERMNYIDLKSIKMNNNSNSKSRNILKFKDKYENYKFDKSKSTLFKQFHCNDPIETFEVEISDDPLEYIINSSDNQISYIESWTEGEYQQIYLPLYSSRHQKVFPKSGLNQWNANGRSRNKDEIYIPIPSWIHQQFEGFFPYNRISKEKGPFILELPDGEELTASICQSNGKGLMSKPNKVLGNWILRKILEATPGEVVTYEDLDRIGIDSVLITKYNKNHFKINVASKGSFTDFEDKFKN